MTRTSLKSLLGFPVLLSSAALLLGVAQGCNSQDSSNQIVQPQDLSDYQRASCEYGFDSGGQVDSGAASSREIRTVYFGKQFDFAPIRAIQHASARATVDFFNTQGVRIFQIPKSVSSCNLFASLAAAPQDFQAYWDRASGDTGKGTIVGLYVENGSPEVASSGTSALIGVREDAYRWVVVHEFMHHQFEVMATAKTQNPSKLKAALKDKLSALNDATEAFDSRKDLAHFRKLARAFLDASPLLRELVTRYPLEEVTIETFLQKEYQAGNFDFMPFLEESSNTYISSSAEKARGVLDDFSSTGDTLVSVATDLNLAETSQLEIENSAIQDLENEIARTLMETGAGLIDSPDFADVLKVKPQQSHCAHERETQKIVEQAKRISSKLRRIFDKRALP